MASEKPPKCLLNGLLLAQSETHSAVAKSGLVIWEDAKTTTKKNNAFATRTIGRVKNQKVLVKETQHTPVQAAHTKAQKTSVTPLPIRCLKFSPLRWKNTQKEKSPFAGLPCVLAHNPL